MDTNELKVDIAVALRAFQHVVDHGESTPEGHVLDGWHASTDYDGYTVTLRDSPRQPADLFPQPLQYRTQNRQSRRTIYGSPGQPGPAGLMNHLLKLHATLVPVLR